MKERRGVVPRVEWVDTAEVLTQREDGWVPQRDSKGQTLRMWATQRHYPLYVTPEGEEGLEGSGVRGDGIGWDREELARGCAKAAAAESGFRVKVVEGTKEGLYKHRWYVVEDQ